MKKQILFALFLSICALGRAQKSGVEIRFSETYELANVILALTPYGISDEWEVQKNTPYYEEIMSQFHFMKGHPLLEKVNYSREKWEDFLSFRSDAFAFEVNAQGKIQRSIDFFANSGHRPFDENLDLIQDFYTASHFHEFYQQHLPYYQGIADRYKAYFMVAETQQFLTEQFGYFESNTNSLIVCSPLVNRMSCRRSIDKNTSADFATLALPLILPNTGEPINQEQRASDIHLVFTETDHGFVNPISDKNARLIRKNFDYTRWDKESGYTGRDCFNEYMTWAVYDLFVQQYFPQYAEQASRDWHFQNNNRGFIASSLFGQKLQSLYAERKPNQRIKDLYPALLNWTKSVQNDLKSPVLTQDSVRVDLAKFQNPIRISFSEPLQKMEALDPVLFKVVNGERQRIQVLDLKAGQNLEIQDNTLILKIPELPKEPGLYGLTFNIQGRKYPLTGQNGVQVACPTRFFIWVDWVD